MSLLEIDSKTKVSEHLFCASDLGVHVVVPKRLIKSDLFLGPALKGDASLWLFQGFEEGS